MYMLFEKIINTAFSFGAAIVIFGAWSKIENKEFGNTALTAGLLTETAIFCIYGLLEWRRKPEPVEKDAPVREVSAQAQPAGKENIEELTSSIRHTVQVLNRIFRV
jgi:hypothetical protein